MDGALAAFLAAIALGYAYAFVSGFTDAANAIATSIGTRAFSPTQAVVIAALFELLGALTGTAVALTIGKGVVHPDLLTPGAVAAALVATMTWSLFTYRLGLPVSETHGLIGGLVGVALGLVGTTAVGWASVVPILLAIVASPVLGIIGGGAILVLVLNLSRGLPRDQAILTFRWLQRLSSIYMAFSHGRNDAQKPMGVLTLALTAYLGWATVEVPLWVILSVATVAGIGVAAGGWRIIRTLGMRITGLSPEQGFAAETGAATVLQLASEVGIPVSTTHTITAAIVGVGLVRNWRSIRWILVREIVVSWVLTLPATVGLGYAIGTLLRLASGG